MWVFISNATRVFFALGLLCALTGWYTSREHTAVPQIGGPHDDEDARTIGEFALAYRTTLTAAHIKAARKHAEQFMREHEEIMREHGSCVWLKTIYQCSCSHDRATNRKIGAAFQRAWVDVI